jgi:hypothetical protein
MLANAREVPIYRSGLVFLPPCCFSALNIPGVSNIVHHELALDVSRKELNVSGRMRFIVFFPWLGRSGRPLVAVIGL